jgi:hypothetical protein
MAVFSAFILFGFNDAVAQIDFHPNKGYIFAKMVRVKDTLTGYFKFENSLTKNGQKVHYRKAKKSRTSRTFYTRKYDYFVSDSVHLETFGGIRMLQNPTGSS